MPERMDSERGHPRAPKSLLSRSLHRWLTFALIVAAFMLANTVYLLVNRLAHYLEWGFFAAGRTSLPKIFQVMILSHTGVGLLLVTLLLVFAAWHLPRVWKRHRPRTVISGIIFVVAGLVLTVTGLFILTSAAAGQRPWAWWAHVGCAVLAPLAYIVHRLTSYVRLTSEHAGRFALVTTSILAVLVAGHGATNRGLQLTSEAERALATGKNKGPGARDRDVRTHSEPGQVSASFVPVASPFFPSAATTTTGDFLPSRIITRGDISSPEKLKPDLETYGFVATEPIGAETCARCHADIVEQWSRSAHRFASFNNPFYEATINDMREKSTAPNDFIRAHQQHYPDTLGREAMIKSKWCSGCHDPSLMLAGMMDKSIDRTLPQAQAGLTCLACHAIDKIHNVTGNGNYNINDQEEDPYIFANAKSGLSAWLHDAAIRAKPEVHKRQMLKPFFRTGEFCATCHKVSLQPTFNNYRWLRGQNEYDNWHDSGVAHNASRTFYLPPMAKTCQDCHMPPEPAVRGDFAAKNGVVRSHRFLAVNTALPFVRGDDETIKRIEAFLRDEKLSVDVFALTSDVSREESGSDTPARTSPDGSRTFMALNRSQPVLLTGEQVEIDVVVRNKGVGHTFPGGTNDSNEGWLEVSLLDEEGETLAISGAIGHDGHLDPHAHRYLALLVDRHGEPIRRRNAQDIHTAVFTRVIGPGTADAAHYRFNVPEKLAGRTIAVRARLLWRKFDRAYTEFAFNTNRSGFKRFEKCPDLPVTEIAADEVSLSVAAADAKSEMSDASHGLPPMTQLDPVESGIALPAEWVRFNDYGIAHLLQGNTRAAEPAFDVVRRLQPRRADGDRNLARVAIADGNLTKAYDHLRACEDLAPADAQTAWFWGLTLQEDGRYAEAAAAYRRVLEVFPRDRAAWRNLGRTLYLDHQYDEALKALDQALAIDPEDRIAHQHKMFCYKSLGDEERAAAAAAAFEHYAIDESAQEITQKLRLQEPGVNLETQLIHVHELEPVAGASAMR